MRNSLVLRAIWLGGALVLALPPVSHAQTRNGVEQDRQTQYRIRFGQMDRNHDGVITRDEWRGSDQSFRRHDWNHDNVLSGPEVALRLPGQRWDDQRRDGQGAPPGGENWSAIDEANRRFNELDRNRDNAIERGEWNADQRDFDWMDANRDGKLSRSEFSDEYADTRQPGEPYARRGVSPGNRPVPRSPGDTRDDVGVNRSAAYRAGYARGMEEGRAAGREDRERNQGWDLEGQRELEQADSGYEPRVGSRADYQAGYREGFRIGYRDGFGPR